MLNITVLKENIYKPNDDSYLFLKALTKQIPLFPQNPIIIEIGCGSGILIANICQLLKDNNPPTFSLAIDINIDACRFTQNIIKQNDLNCDVINSDGLKGININNIDIVIFNPPYVPTEQEEVDNCQKYFKEKQDLFKKAYHDNLRGEELLEKVSEVNMIDYSYCGGKEGMEVTWTVLNDLMKRSIAIMYIYHKTIVIYLLFRIIQQKILFNLCKNMDIPILFQKNSNVTMRFSQF